MYRTPNSRQWTVIHTLTETLVTEPVRFAA